MSDAISDRLHQMVLEKISGQATGGRRRRRSRSRSRSRSVSFKGRGLSGGRRRSSSRKRSSSRGRGLSGGARGDATSQFNKAVSLLVKLGRGAFDRFAAERALLKNEDNELPERVKGTKFTDVREMVPEYFWTSAKAKKMLADIDYEEAREGEQLTKGDALGKILGSLSYDSLKALADDKSTKLGERLAIAEMLKGSGMSGGRRRRSRSAKRSSKKLTQWQRIVKKHAGDMASAKREYYGSGLEGGRMRKRTSSKKKRSSSRHRGSALGRTY